MFVAANRSRRTVNHLDDFHAAIVAKDEDAIEIANVVAAAGLRVSRKTGSKSWIPGEVTFTAAIRKVMSRHGDKLAKDVLIALARAFPDQVLSNGSSIFTALASISITPPPGGIDRDRLEMSLRAFDMKGSGTFMVGCKGGDDRRRAMREAILMKYEEVGPQPAQPSTGRRARRHAGGRGIWRATSMGKARQIYFLWYNPWYMLKYSKNYCSNTI